MINTTRREFLVGAGAAAGTLLAGVTPLLAGGDTSGSASALMARAPLKGHLNTFGLDGRYYPGYHTSAPNVFGILTSLNLEDGSIRQTPLEIHGEAHAAMAIGDGRLLCTSQYAKRTMMLAPDHKILGIFEAPDGYQYSGHGVVLADRNVFALTLGATGKTTDGRGRLEVRDLTTLKPIDFLDSGGVDPHEINKIPGTDEIVLAQSGDLHNAKSYPLAYNAVDSKLTVLDAATLKPKRHYPQSDLNAIITHVRADEEGWAYFIVAQFVKFGTTDNRNSDESIFSAAMTKAEAYSGKRYDFPIPYQSAYEKHIAPPLPFVRVNTRTGERQIINTGDRNHIRSQSVAYNHATKTAIGLYFYSDLLVLHTPGREPEIITGNQLGLSQLRGVTEIPGTTCIAACGFHCGMSVMDLATRKVIAHYPTVNYTAAHLYHDAYA